MNLKNSSILALALGSALALGACKDHGGDNESTAADNAPSSPATSPPSDNGNPPATDVAASPAMPSGSPDNNVAFADLDKNHDGSITPDELADGSDLKANFSKADANGDGKLTEDELNAYRNAQSAAPNAASNAMSSGPGS